jgi:hypothetical protein
VYGIIVTFNKTRIEIIPIDMSTNFAIHIVVDSILIGFRERSNFYDQEIKVFRVEGFMVYQQVSREGKALGKCCCRFRRPEF